MARKSYTKSWMEIEGQAVPFRLYREWRRNVSYSITNSAVVLRVPVLLQKAKLGSVIESAHQQTLRYFEAHPEIRKRFIRKIYQDTDQLQLGDRLYQLEIGLEDRKTDGFKIRGSYIQLSLNKSLPEESRQDRIRKLLSRAVAKDQLPRVRERVLQLNELFFRKPIHDVRLKYNHSNWGSCSTNGRINLSTRLLFAPEEVIDYVIIHELAHLIEMNHSPAFWKLVADAMPEYPQYISWLKKEGVVCDF
ncbi:MAG: M48 family metallopeptidase [Saprospiraceae bacterium]|nr:M48 family metallopeptidase [Saprospiraceae bacterium]